MCLISRRSTSIKRTASWTKTYFNKFPVNSSPKYNLTNQFQNSIQIAKWKVASFTRALQNGKNNSIR